MAHLYRVVGYSYEGGPNITLTHETRFTPEQFEALIAKAIVAAIPAKDVLDICRGPYYSLEDLHHGMIAHLIAEEGFTHTEYAVEFCYSAWSGLNGERFEWEANESSKRMMEALSAAGFSTEFFEEWCENRPDLNIHMPDLDSQAGFFAGLAFRLNEILGRRFFTRTPTAQELE